MEYPDDFPPEYQAAVEGEKIRAERVFAECQSRLSIDYGFEAKLTSCVRKYVMKIALEFAKQACRLGMSRTWTVPQIDYEVHEFIEQLTCGAHNEKRFDCNGIHASKMAFLNYVDKRVLPELMHSFKNSEEWKSYQDELLKVTDFQAATVVVGGSPSISNPAKDGTTEPSVPIDVGEMVRVAKTMGISVFVHEAGISKAAYHQIRHGGGGRKVRTAVGLLLLKSKSLKKV